MTHALTMKDERLVRALALTYKLCGVLFGIAAIWTSVLIFDKLESLQSVLWIAFVLACVLVSALGFLTALSLQRGRHWGFCVVVSAMYLLLLVPIGSVVGLFGLIVLYRHSVRSSFS